MFKIQKFFDAEKTFGVLAVLSGLFFYKISNLERFFPAQEGFLVFMAVFLMAVMIWPKNKWLAMITVLGAIGFLKTYLLSHAPQPDLFKLSLLCIGLCLVYLFARNYRLKQRHLRYFLIPALLNIAVVIIQNFDHFYLPGLPVKGMTGFLGNKSFVGYYLALTTPIFLEHDKRLLPLVAFTLVLTGSFFGQLAFLVILFIYLWANGKRYLLVYTAALICLVVFICLTPKIDNFIVVAKERACNILGALDGIGRYPILGWGVGSWDVIVRQIPPNDIVYFGKQFNTPGAVTNHPHNEIVFGWWNLGVLFVPLVVFLVTDVIRQYRKRLLTPFLILLGGFICIQGTFFTPPLWIIMMVALAVYENEQEEENDQKVYKKT